jgi:hypothetical protein
MLIPTLLSFLLLIPVPVHAESFITIDPPVLPVALLPAMRPICGCESAGSPTKTPIQFNPDGSVLHGKVNPHDIGMCQISETFNGATATAHGWDIYTTEGNIKMANWMYKNQGTAPWNWSKSCWK